MKVTFFGDIALNGKYIEFYKQGIQPFEEIRNYYHDSYKIGNLECFAKGSEGVNLLKRPRLDTTTQTLNYLKQIGLNLACLANNHVYDHLEDGFRKTINLLQKNSIKHIGASLDENEYQKYIIITDNAISIGLLNYVTRDTNPKPPLNTSIFANYFDIVKLSKSIRFLKSKVDHIVLAIHWGGRVEGGRFPDWSQNNTAHSLIDMGVDLIIGHHSHTIQPFEVYKGKYIFYSLGNFCFSEFFYDQRKYNLDRSARKSIIPTATFSKESYTIDIDKWKNLDGFITERIKYTPGIFNFMFMVLSNCYFAWKLYYYYLKKIKPIIKFLFKDGSLWKRIKQLNYAAIKRFFFT